MAGSSKSAKGSLPKRSLMATQPATAPGTVTAPVYTPVGGDWDFVNYQVGLVFKPTQNSSPPTA